MIKELPDTALECLLVLFNCIWLSDSLPEDWLHYQVVFIDKPEKEKVRPISLSSCVGKLCERMINERLIWWAESAHKFNPSQNGFRRGKSCADNLVKIVSDIRASISSGEYTLAAFLDVSGAYDNVEFCTMIETLIALECPAGMGAVLSPALYSLYTGRVCTDLPEGVQSCEFADDIGLGLYVCGPNRQRNRDLLQLAVNLVAERLCRIGLDLEPQKTVIVEFNKYGLYNENQSMVIQGCEVFYSRESKFLGIWIDNGLKFSHQIQEVWSKVDRANAVIQYLCRISKGLEVNTALMLYKSLVCSITDYGSFVYHPRDANSVLKLERTQYKGIRTALGYRNSTPNNVIVAEAKVRLLTDRAEMLARNYLYKAMAHNLDGVCDRIQRAYDSELRVRYRQPTYLMSLMSRVWRRCAPVRTLIGPQRIHETFWEEFEAHDYVPVVDFTIGLLRKGNSEYSDASMIEDIIEKYQLSNEAEIVFTDGSHGPDWQATGDSIVIDGQDTAYKISMSKVCSSYTAEIFAINAALKLVKTSRETRNNHIVIMSDCKSALSAVQNNLISVHKSKYAVETRLLIYSLERERNMKIVLVWIPAHVGIAGNELADGLAKEAAQEPPDESIEVPTGDLMAMAREETWQATQASIKRDSVFKGKLYFSKFYDEEARKPWFSGINAERYYVTLINRIRADHYNLGSSLFRKNYIDTPRCECGYEREDLMHVILRCHKYDDLRIKLDEDLRAVGYLAEINVYKSNGLKLNPAKSKAMIYGSNAYVRNIDLSLLPPIIVNQVPIPFVSEVRNLGVVFTPTLSWKKHISHVSQKVHYALYRLKFNRNSLSTELRIKLVTTLITLHVDYCCLVYDGLSHELNMKLQRL
ncbi:uncharacterized protein LOC112463950, partial [Temnothorax curvispinosus]|uniref:Uncharacterized protein LOC112463950 n=1 Tax=Temnothorax curvispinosus TaxID=300111 RepID=A0A6J1QX56_9HYME